ncbi:MAG: LysR family transcriptional regulator [Bdellovibrionota bacterium]
MELNHLKYFYEVARAGSFTAAARSLKVSQPSLSKTVALLEEREGVKLLERSKAGVKLTLLGETVYVECEKLFASVREISKICHNTSEVCEGYLRFGASDHVANYLLLDALRDLSKKHARVVPSIFVGAPTEVVQKILKREIEFGFSFTTLPVPQLHYSPLMAIEQVGVMRPGEGVLKKKRGQAPSKFIGSIKSNYQRHPAQDLLDEFSPIPEIGFETNNQEMQKRLCLKGVGFTILPKFMVKNELTRGQLVKVPCKGELGAVLHIVTRTNHTLSLNAREFLEVFKKSLKLRS